MADFYDRPDSRSSPDEPLPQFLARVRRMSSGEYMPAHVLAEYMPGYAERMRAVHARIGLTLEQRREWERNRDRMRARDRRLENMVRRKRRQAEAVQP